MPTMTYDYGIAHDELRPLQEIVPMTIDRSISYAELFGQAEHSLRFMRQRATARESRVAKQRYESAALGVFHLWRALASELAKQAGPAAVVEYETDYARLAVLLKYDTPLESRRDPGH